MIVQWMERAASRRAANAAEARSVSAHENRRWYGTWLFTIIFLIRTHYFDLFWGTHIAIFGVSVNFVKSESNWGFTSQPCLIARGQIGMRDQKLAGSIRNMQYMKKHVKLRVSFSKKRDSILVPKSMCTPNYWNNQFYNTLLWSFWCWAAQAIPTLHFVANLLQHAQLVGGFICSESSNPTPELQSSIWYNF